MDTLSDLTSYLRPTSTTLLVAVALLAATFFLSPYLLLNSPFSLSSRNAPKRKKKGSKTILLVGPVGSGKTSLFSQLVYGHRIKTHTSIKENEAVVKTCFLSVSAVGGDADKEGEGEKYDDELTEPTNTISTPSPSTFTLKTPLSLIDIPGHPRLRTRLLSTYLPAADGIVFTINSTTGLSGKGLRDSSEHLHLLLTLLTLLPSSAPVPPILILLTRTPSPPPPTLLQRAKTSLSRDLDRRRLAPQNSTLDSLGGEGDDTRGDALPTEEEEVWKLGKAVGGGVFGGDVGDGGSGWDWDKVEGVEWAVVEDQSGDGKGEEKLWDWIEGL